MTRASNFSRFRRAGLGFKVSMLVCAVAKPAVADKDNNNRQTSARIRFST